MRLQRASHEEPKFSLLKSFFIFNLIETGSTDSDDRDLRRNIPAPTNHFTHT